MIVAAHQPAFLPWLGYLDKLAKSDLFVVMDDLQFEQANFQNRNRLKLAAGPQWMTVPLVRGSQISNVSAPLLGTSPSTAGLRAAAAGAPPSIRSDLDV